jgi:hypothetical protein
MKISILVLYIFFSAYSCSIVAQSDYGLTVFGTDLIAAEQVKINYRKEFNELIELDKSDSDGYEKRKLELETELNNNSFSYVNIKLFESYTGNKDFIIDFVENKDAARRLAYQELKPKKLSDPDDLVAKWNEYAILSKALFDKGEISDMQCPVIHCTWAFNHVKLTPFLEYFNSNIPNNTSKLKELLIYSDNTEYRANAAFLFAHANIKNQDLVKFLEPAIEDPSSLVRNNSMRVIYYAIRENNNLEIPLDKIIDVLDFPSFTDRNKALVVLRSLPKDRFSNDQINRIIPILLEILKKKDAHNYKNAYIVIKNISGKDFNVDDLTSWTNWSLANINKTN